MIYKDLLTLIIIFLIVLALGLRMAEEGVYSTMGLDKKPASFDFAFNVRDRTYDLSILGRHWQFTSILKITDFYADRKKISIKFLGKDIEFHPLINLGLKFKSGVNLDKKSAEMYN